MEPETKSRSNQENLKEEARSKQGQKNWNIRLTEASVLKIRRLAGNADSKSKGRRVRLWEYTITEKLLRCFISHQCM